MNPCFGNICAITDHTLLGDNITVVWISKMSKHVKDHEVKIGSQVDWRKLSSLKKKKMEMEKKHLVSFTSQEESLSESTVSHDKMRPGTRKDLCWLFSHHQSIQRRSPVTGSENVCGRHGEGNFLPGKIQGEYRTR